MNNAGSDFAVSDKLNRALDNLTDIHRHMRWLELAHAVSPSDQDLPDYKMLVDDLTAVLTTILNEITNPTEPDPADPVALAASAFPLAISAVMSGPARQPAPRTPGAPPGVPSTRSGP